MALLCFRKIQVSTKFMHRSGISSFFCRNFSVSLRRKRSQSNPPVFEKVSDIGKIYGYGGGYHFFPPNVIVSEYWKFLRWTFQYFSSFSISKMFTPTRVISRFSVGTTLAVSTGIIRRGPLLCLLKIWFRKTLCIGGGNRVPLSEMLCLTVLENFVEDPYVLKKYSVFQELFAQEGKIRFFGREYFV